MPAASSLTNRVFLACTLLAMLSLGFAFYFVNERASTEAEADLRRGLLEAGTLVDQYGATRIDHFTRLARVVADLPKLKAAVETGDPPTVQPLADEYRDRSRRRPARARPAAAARCSEPPAPTRRPSPPPVDDAQSLRRDLHVHVRTHAGVLQLVSVPILLEGDDPGHSWPAHGWRLSRRPRGQRGQGD